MVTGRRIDARARRSRRHLERRPARAADRAGRRPATASRRSSAWRTAPVVDRRCSPPRRSSRSSTARGRRASTGSIITRASATTRWCRRPARDLVATDRGLHVRAPRRGPTSPATRHGFMVAGYLDAVRARRPPASGRSSQARREPSRAPRDLAIVLTADHGGAPERATSTRRPALANYRVPFVVWGRASRRPTSTGSTPHYRDPGNAPRRPTRRPGSRCATATSPTSRSTCSALAAVPGSSGKKHPLHVS